MVVTQLLAVDMKNIDWRNHFIAFFSALLGILIAFQLEDFRENREQLERTNTAYDLVIAEIENNIAIYKENVNLIGSWLTYYNIAKDLSMGVVDNVQVPKSTFNQIHLDSTKIYRLSDFRISFKNDSIVEIRRKGMIDDKGIYDIDVDILPKVGIATSAWNSSINSGIFSQLSPNRLSELTKIYDWINNDLGKNENAFYEYGISIDREIDDLETIEYNYQVIFEVQKFKLNRILPIYNGIKKLDN